VADVNRLVESLTTEEMAALTAGEDMMSTVPVDRVGIPKIRLTDGPNGARGASHPGVGGPPSLCTPCGTAMGATWDPGLVEELGALIGREAFDRGCRGLLAPTVNLHRSLLAGRNFECFSEDPLLTGRLAASYVRGVQSEGVFATVKHFVANDAEFERGSMSSEVDERTLREIYLVPFELTVREGGALAIMTAYNRLNGRWITERRDLLIDLLREEWGFRGLVMTDWFGIADTASSLGAGLDLEMPGPGRSFGRPVLDRIEAGDRALEADLRAAAGRLLGGFERIGALDAPTPPHRPGTPSAEDLSLIRRAAAGASVLLTNDGTLPLAPAELHRVAILGPHAMSPRLEGGGSARVIPHRRTSPLEALTAVLGEGVELVCERGCEVDLSPAVVGQTVLRAPDGFGFEVFDGLDLVGEPIHRGQLAELRQFVFHSDAQGFPAGEWSMRIRGTVVPEETGVFELALAQSGRARLLIDGEVVLDGFENPPPRGGRDFFGSASEDLVADVAFERGSATEFLVEYARIDARSAGVRVGYRTRDLDVLLERAVAAAAQADVALLFGGTTDEWETEGRDRDSLRLPGRQDELIRRVAAANERTVVVINAGAVVDLPWCDDVSALLQCWFGGEEMAAAVADILVGNSEPGGRLPTTIPHCLEHTPSFDNFPGENGQLRYGEGVFMGYRGYEHRRIEPRFAFGHGLSYTRISIEQPTVSAPTFSPGQMLTVSVPVRNVGDRSGAEVVQCYVAPRSSRLARPPKELKAFGKICLEPGESGVVTLSLDDRSFAYWDPGQPDWEELVDRFTLMSEHVMVQDRRSRGWQVDAGIYDLIIGRSARDIVATVTIEVLTS
jgi:beta-glucosidase